MLKTINIPKDTSITVLGDIHEHEEQFDEIIEKIKPSPTNLLVSIGDIYNKGYGIEVAESIINKLQALVDKGHAFVLKGNHELKKMRQARKDAALATDELFWISNQPLAVSFKFANKTLLTVVHGGITPRTTWEELDTNTEIAYVKFVSKDGNYIPLIWKKQADGTKALVPKAEGKVWHEYYDGRFGYIASGHYAQKDGIPKFYKYSCNLDTAVSQTGILTAQTFNENGRGKLIQIKGKAWTMT